GFSGGRALGDQLQRRGLQGSGGLGDVAVGSQRAVEISRAGDAQLRIDERRLGEIEFLEGELCLHWRERGVGRIDWTGGAIDFQTAAAGEADGRDHGKLVSKRKIAHRDVDVVVLDGFPLAGKGSDGDGSVVQVEPGYVHI